MQGESLRKPIFVLGFPRSGTSVLRLKLSRHPQIVIPPECSVISWFYNKYHAWRSVNTSSVLLESFVRDLSSARKWDTWKVDSQSLFSFLRARRPADYSSLMALVFRHYGEYHGRNEFRWGDKNNVHIKYVGLLKHLYPEAQFILLTRDIRAVYASIKSVESVSRNNPYRPNFTLNPQRISDEWVSQNRAALVELDTLSPQQVIRIRYEDMVRDSSSTFKDIFDFLDIQPDSIEEFLAMKPDFFSTEPLETIPWKRMTNNSLNPSRLSSWRAELSPRELAAILSPEASELINYLSRK